MATDPYAILCEANPQVCGSFATSPFVDPIQGTFDHFSGYGMAATQATPPENTITLFLHPRYHKVAGLEGFARGLTLLRLIRCRITSLGGIKAAANLRFLWLDDNKVVNVTDLESLQQLEYLSLSDNSLTDKALSEFRSSSIRCLSVANNPVYYTTWLANYPKLAHLDLSRTNISHFNVLPILCPRLHSIDISATQIYNSVSLLNMLQGAFPLLRSIHVESRAGRTPLFELMSDAEVEQFFAYIIVTYDLQLRSLNGFKYTNAELIKHYNLAINTPSMKHYRLCTLMLTLDINQFIAACDAYARPLLEVVYTNYDQFKCDLLDIRLLLLCKEHIKDYISAAEAENTVSIQQTFSDLHKLGFVEVNGIMQNLAAVLSLLRRLYLKYCEVIGLTFSRVSLVKTCTGLADTLFPTQRANLEEHVSKASIYSMVYSNSTTDIYFTKRKYQALEISETCIAPTLQYLEEVSAVNCDPIMYIRMADIFDFKGDVVYRDTSFPLNLIALLHEVIGAQIICTTGRILGLTVAPRSAIMKQEGTEDANEKITEVLTEDLYKRYFQAVADPDKKNVHPFNVRAGLRRVLLHREIELPDLISRCRPGEPLVLIALKLAKQTIVVQDSKHYLDLNTTIYTTVGSTVIYTDPSVSSTTQPSRAEQLTKVKVQCTSNKVSKHHIPIMHSSHDQLLRWLMTLIWRQYKIHIDALSNVLPECIFTSTEEKMKRSHGNEKSDPENVPVSSFVLLVNLIAHQGEVTFERIAVERGVITLQQPESAATYVDLHNCGLTDKMVQEGPNILSRYIHAKHISLACNLLTSVTISLENLVSLDLSCNVLKEISIDCPNLVFLDLSSNNIQHISDVLRGLSAVTRQSIRHIFIYNNPFTMQSFINMYYTLHLVGFLVNLQSINGRMIKPLISRAFLSGNPAMLCEVFDVFAKNKDLTASIMLLDGADNAGNPPWMTLLYNLTAPDSGPLADPKTGVTRTYFELSPVILGEFINYSMIGAFDVPRMVPDTLRSVDLSYNIVVKPNNLLGHSALRVLNLSNCKITSRTLDLLTRSLTDIVELNVSCNNITNVNSLAPYSNSLVTLHLDCNPGLDIGTLPEMNALKTISCVGIKSTAEQVAVVLSNRCFNCTHVILPYAETIPGIIYMLQLQSLNCAQINPAMVRQNRLKLVGSLNQEFVTSVNAWNGKNVLSLANSGVITLNFEKGLLDMVTATETIFASGNAITNIAVIKEYTSLIQIDVSYNKIVDPFNGLKSNTLEAINLSFNPFTAMKITNTSLPALKCLILRGCNITSLPNNAFTAIGRVLTYLDIGENQLITVSKECFSGLTKLKTLKCDLCNLRSVEFLEPLSSYGTLLLLDIRSNKIHSGEKTIDTLKKLRSMTKLFVADNPFSAREKNVLEFRVKLFYALENLVELEGMAKTAEEVSRLEQYIQWRLEKEAKNEVQIVRFSIGEPVHSASQPVLPMVRNPLPPCGIRHPQSTDRPSIGATRRPSARPATKPSLNGIVITGISKPT